MSTGGVVTPWVGPGGPCNPRAEGAARVRRALFGPVDHAANAEFVRQELANIRREDRERWNFDFETGTPLPGRYEWSEVTPEKRPRVSSPPSAEEHRLAVHDEAADPHHHTATLTKLFRSLSAPGVAMETEMVAQATKDDAEHDAPVAALTAQNLQGGVSHLRQSRITEFMQEEKPSRNITDKQSCGSPPTPAPVCSTCRRASS